ncbi:MAG: segregation/condensation protein A [Anaerolineae bacterium]|jgi:segregation and condensation protein A
MMATSQFSDSTKQDENYDTQRYQVHLPMFEGPLGLLLHLIEREELDITKVALAQVTDQYLAYLAVLKEVEVEFLTDFLVVAAKLLFIKSQALLPRPPPSLIDEEEEDIGDQLARQLRAYKQFKTVAQALRQQEADGLRSFIRLAPAPKLEPKLSLGEVTLDDLVAAVRQALAVRPADPAVSEVVSPVTVTIGEQMALIRDELTHQRQISFQRLLRQVTTRVEVIVTFLAVLELIKQYEIEVRQDILFGEIVISPHMDRPQEEGAYPQTGRVDGSVEAEDGTDSPLPGQGNPQE